MLATFANGDREDMRKSARHKTALSCTRYEQDMSTLLEMMRRGNGNSNMLNLVPKWVKIYIRNHNTGSLVNVLAGDDNSIKFTTLHHHASYFFTKLLNLDTRELHVLHNKTLEYGNRQSAKEKLDEALLSLNDITKLRILSAVEDLVNERVMLERHSFSTSQFASTDATLIGGEASVAGLTVKKRKTSNEGKIDLQMRHRLK